VSPGLDISLFYITFVFYFGGFLAFSFYAAFRTTLWCKLGSSLFIAALAPHTAAFLVRWSISGHVPLSNMYEYMSLMSWMATVTLLWVYFRYKKPAIGTYLSPVVFMLMVAAALLPKDMSQSLMPALQSIWLMIHVSLAALGAGCFLIAFAASAVFLLRIYNPDNYRKAAGLMKQMTRSIWIFLVMVPLGLAAVLSLAGITPPTPDSHFGPVGSSFNAGGFFVIGGMGFILGVLLLCYFWPGRNGSGRSGFGWWFFITALICFLLGGLVEGALLRIGWLELTHSLPVEDGGSVKSVWLIFEFFGAAYIAGLILAIFLVPLSGAVSRIPEERLPISLALLDEISYKAVSLGYPLYTVGALFAGAIWAEQAWGQFWSWDPKEVGALITWFFFSGYLHARYLRGWTGSRTAALAVAGFLIVLLSFFGNYFFGGLHAYA